MFDKLTDTCIINNLQQKENPNTQSGKVQKGQTRELEILQEKWIIDILRLTHHK